MKQFRIVVTGWMFVVLVACGHDDGSDVTNDLMDAQPDADMAVADLNSDGDGSDGDNAMDVQDEDTQDDVVAECNSTEVSIIRGMVEDQEGLPLDGAKAQSCIRVQDGTLVCLRPAETDSTGLFASSVPQMARCMTALTMRVLMTNEPLPTVYCPVSLPDPGGSPVVAIDEPFVLRPATPPAMLPPLGDGGVERTIDFDGISLDVVPDRLQYSGGGYEDLAMLVADPSAADLCFLPEQRPAMLFAFYPEANVDQSGFDFVIENTAELPAGTEVDLQVLGGLDCRLDDGTAVEEGSWHRYASGTVSQDGATIIPSAGLPCLTWLGITVP